MKLKFFILMILINSFMFQQYKDTDCYKSAGNSASECKLFTTFVNGDPIEIKEKVLYLCCYVNDAEYQGCKPIEENIVFGEHEGLSFDCKSSFNKIQLFLFLLCISSIF